MQCVIDLPALKNSSELEAPVQCSGQPHRKDVFGVEFRFPVGSKLMIDAAIRIVSLANQLA